MSWMSILKFKGPPPLALITGQDSRYFIDKITYKYPEFPLGRPVDISDKGEANRVFIFQDELDWIEKTKAEGNPKSGDNPYYAPEHGPPDNYVDIKSSDGGYTIEYVAGSKKLFNTLLKEMEEVQ